jgi:hypothetical protein
MKTRPMGAEFHASGRTDGRTDGGREQADMANLIVAFFGILPKRLTASPRTDLITSSTMFRLKLKVVLWLYKNTYIKTTLTIHDKNSVIKMCLRFLSLIFHRVVYR